MKRHKYRSRDESRSPAELKHSSLKSHFVSFFFFLSDSKRRASCRVTTVRQGGLVGGPARGWVGVANRRPIGRDMILLESSRFLLDHCITSPPLQPLRGRTRGRSLNSPIVPADQPGWLRLTGAASLPPSRCRAAAVVPLKAHSRSSAPRSEEESE